MIIKGFNSFQLSHEDKVVEELSLYIKELTRWNSRMNLVGIKEETQIVEELLYDAFFVFGHVKGSTRILDLGSGSGILAIPLKIMDRGMEVYSVDKSLRKIQFQRHIRRRLSLQGFLPIHGRIEALDPLSVESVVVKGFGPIPMILEMSRAHMVAGGRALIVKGAKEEGAEEAGFHIENVIPYTLPGSPKRYRLFIYRRFS